MSQKISSNLDRVEFRPLEKFPKVKNAQNISKYLKISQNISKNLE